MNEIYLQNILREGLYLILIVSAPPVIASLIVGLIVNVFQVMTQLQDHTLSFVPKLLAVFATLIISGPWIGAQLLRFTQTLMQAIPLLR